MGNKFLTDLFGEQEGIVYAPVKGDNFKQHFFEWPQERDKLESHIRDYNKRDVYLSPVLFTDKRISPETFKGTNYLWTEFDGVVPSDPIEPSIRVMSSNPGHEHWYWIAYHYGADLSVWDYQNVLRPVDTWNHKRNKPVTLLHKSDVTYSVNDFLWVPIPDAGTRVDIKLGSLPTRDEVLARYKWTYDALDLMFKVVEKGKRSQALARLAHECAEIGLSNEEIYVMVEERDRVWGKFVGRNDREKRLQGFILTVRSKRAVVAEIVQGATEVYRFNDFMKTTIVLKWAVEGLLPVAGSMVIFGSPGIGKSTFSLRLAMSLSLGDESFLNWKIINRQKTLFISLEMQHDELKQFFLDMQLTEEKNEALQDWFHIWPIGHAYPFDTPDQQIELLKYIDMHKIELIIIDSLSLSMYGSVKDDDDIKRLNSFLNEDVRKARKCGYIFIHHPRKDGMDVKKVKDQSDSFGSMYITANAQTVVLLSQKPGSVKMHVEMIKTRLSIGEEKFEIERTSDRGFKLAGSISSVFTPAVISGEIVTDKKPDDGSLGKLFNF